MSIRFDYDFDTKTVIICDMPGDSTVVIDGIEYMPEQTCIAHRHERLVPTSLTTMKTIVLYTCSRCTNLIDISDDYCKRCGARIIDFMNCNEKVEDNQHKHDNYTPAKERK